jgi:hypothetical protein
MRPMRQTGTAVFLLLLLAACEGNDFLLRPSGRNPQQSFEPRLVIESFIAPHDTVLQVRVRRTRPALGPQPAWGTEMVTNATVVLADSLQAVTLPLQDRAQGLYQTNTRVLRILPGRRYTLEVTTPDGLRATAECRPPQRVVPLAGIRSQINQADDTFFVEWRDFPGEANYYGFKQLGYTQFRNPAGVLISLEATTFYRDLGADGQWLKTKEMNYLESYSQPNGNIYWSEVWVMTTDEAYFRYHQSLQDFAAARENPFSEPGRMYTNITGGYGVFAAYGRSRIRY